MVTDLGEQPAPQVEPAEPPPGGVDAVEETLYETQPLVPDLSQVGNEGGVDKVPDEVTEPEDTDTEATRDAAPGRDDESGASHEGRTTDGQPDAEKEPSG
jgi:hypothetical protein